MISGIPLRAPGCDAPPPGPVYMGPNDTFVCRCVVCARCKHHTGNSNQGHYWAWCKVLKSMQVHHFCCPDNCELWEAIKAANDFEEEAA